MSKCNQCGRPAVSAVGGSPLCVDCLLKFQQAMQLENIRSAQWINYLSDMAEAAVGVYGATPRIEIPQPVIQRGPVSFKNINIDRSIVGSVSIDNIGKIDVAMDFLQTKGNQELAQLLKEFTEQVSKNKEIDVELKKEILEQLSFVASQITTPKGKRNKSVLKLIFQGIRDTIGNASELLVLWQKLQEVLENLFS